MCIVCSALEVFIIISTNIIPMIHISLFINFHHLNVSVVQCSYGWTLNLMSSSSLSWPFEPYSARWHLTWWPPDCSYFFAENGGFYDIFPYVLSVLVRTLLTPERFLFNIINLYVRTLCLPIYQPLFSSYVFLPLACSSILLIVIYFHFY